MEARNKGERKLLLDSKKDKPSKRPEVVKFSVEFYQSGVLSHYAASC